MWLRPFRAPWVQRGIRLRYLLKGDTMSKIERYEHWGVQLVQALTTLLNADSDEDGMLFKRVLWAEAHYEAACLTM